jgi:hypothetical protein
MLLSDQAVVSIVLPVLPSPILVVPRLWFRPSALRRSWNNQRMLQRGLDWTHRRNSRTMGLHTTTPGSGIPPWGGLQEYCVISSSGHSVRLTVLPLRRLSWKFRRTVLT